MDWLKNNIDLLVTIIGAVTTFTIAITSLLKVIKSEKRTTARLDRRDREVSERLDIADTNVKITREGIVQAFKGAIVPNDLKISINKQVEKVMDRKFSEILDELKKNEEQRTKLTYWAVRILEHTAASDKLTVEQKAELYDTLTLIANDEQIIDTLT